ncbi:MAG TPA: sulfate reduction electron transfer complex DsrMKJOP subunit DsrJ [Anaeromyxobacteraceae bacterium]|nr:sulfate reduction electron transfer complex DsrMKJOP subunit DsrJ [Anaeromyxobacteraceae bacterium]
MHDAGKIFLGLGVFVGLVGAPVWYGLGRGPGAPPELEKAVEGPRCVEPTEVMRASHMQLLDQWRTAVVRRAEHVYVASDGRQHAMSLTGTCLRCHADPAKFCDRCHGYVGVEAFCWDCHQRKRRSGS